MLYTLFFITSSKHDNMILLWFEIVVGGMAYALYCCVPRISRLLAVGSKQELFTKMAIFQIFLLRNPSQINCASHRAIERVVKHFMATSISSLFR